MEKALHSCLPDNAQQQPQQHRRCCGGSPCRAAQRRTQFDFGKVLRYTSFSFLVVWALHTRALTNRMYSQIVRACKHAARLIFYATTLPTMTALRRGGGRVNNQKQSRPKAQQQCPFSTTLLVGTHSERNEDGIFFPSTILTFLFV